MSILICVGVTGELWSEGLCGLASPIGDGDGPIATADDLVPC